jgi:multiple sugar transport system substrate-binding protein
MKAVRGGAAVLALGLVLAACSGGDDGTGSTGDGSGTGGETGSGEGVEGVEGEGVDDGTELTMWTRAPLERQATLLVDAYNESHENQVNLEIVPNDDMEGKVGAAAQNGDLPDLLAGDVVRLPYWVDNGLFTDLTDQIEGLASFDDIAVGHIDAGTTPDGARHTLPFVTDVSVMVWNKDLYEQAGLDPEQGPTSMAEFQEQAEAVQALGQDGVSGTYFGGNCGGCLVFTWFPSIWASGDEVISQDGRESLLAGESATALYDVYAALEEGGAIGAGSNEETGATWTAPFSEGKVGVMQYPNTAVYSAIEAGIDVGVGPIPGMDGGTSTFLGGDAMGISKDSENVDAAWNFLSWLVSEDAQLEVVAKNGEVPALTTLLDNTYAAQDPIALTINSVVENGRTPVAPYFSEAFNASGSPWVSMVRTATFDGGDSVEADNELITEVLDQ